VSPEDIVKCEERYNKGKMVHSILRHVAEKTNIPIENLYHDIGWPLNKKYGHAVDAFKLSITYALHSLPGIHMLTWEQNPRCVE
jgi:translation initiation factor 2 subunit 1